MSVEYPEIRLAAPVAIIVPSGALPVKSVTARGLLARLAQAPGQLVAYHQLTESIWEEREPRSAKSNLRTAAASLRRALGSGERDPAEVLRTYRASPGQANGAMSLDLPESAIDLFQVTRKVDAAFEHIRADRLSECRRLCRELESVDLTGFGTDLPATRWFGVLAQRVQRLWLRMNLVRCKTALLDGDFVVAERIAVTLHRSQAAIDPGEALLTVTQFFLGDTAQSLEHLTALRDRHSALGLDWPPHFDRLQHAILNHSHAEVREIARVDLVL
ncbi:AfsR/SARP family transcriptional regulator [Glycomyces salinus]|uniref:AfsR/SARP family transcriptional regulator n=1 Tax=Glycomyces salinus TaxID=980294 RepID=UPI0018EE2AA0|nr:winged helix-turn-helix domain-containing protein [Glycomyces salinus]